ncbi:thiol reductant ABC exporter subunit CydD [Luteimonas sp. RC10]|uniref:thiol reductant ABC exporter subunit CydD n=1 Tax=Luteimonas sp. RC10 TaxID=2587035 RepID=UPI00162086E7|nr:thiol reductant ABC exporter subunit CydD [Luteimonas sp. RC10]MBB3343128.1 ATP-binding cassette subfamily C protein CydD [Luteimonas sp. RC10]
MTSPPQGKDRTGPRRLRLQWLDAQLLPSRSRHRVAQASQVLAGWLLVPQAAAIAWGLDAALIDAHGAGALHAPLALLAVTLLARTLLGWLGQRAAADAVEDTLARMRVGLARAAIARGPVWLRGRRSGELVALSTGHVDAAAPYFGGYLLARAEVMLVPPVLLAAVFAADWIVGLLLLAAAPLAPFFMALIGMRAEAAGRAQLSALARAGAHFTDRLRGLDLIRVYGRGEAELAQVGEATETIRVRSMRVLRIAFLSSTVLEFFASVSVALVALYFGFSYLGLIALRDPAPTLATGLFCLLLAPEFHGPMRRLAGHYHDRANALAAVAEVEAAFDDSRPALSAVPAADPAPMTPGAPAVRIEAVTLRHPGAAVPALAGASRDIPAGQRLAIVAPSGGGKSTLLDALAGWLPPESGRIHVPAGTTIALAGQRPWLFQGSLLDNLRIGAPQADEVAVREAAQIAQVTRFAAHLPEGLHTPIGEHGFGLSGGQARRVALARALLLRPQLLLLDEPTAFLDPATEADLLAALDTSLRDCTVIVATHSQAVMDWADAVWRLPGPLAAPVEPAMEAAR